MKVAYFAHELRDPAVQRRVRMLKAAGAEIVLLGFERRDFPVEPGAEAPTYCLGRTESGRLLARVFAVLFAIPKALRLRAHWAGADAILARNLEMLTIVCAAAALTGVKPRIVYECLDIHRLLLGKGLASQALRALERACLGRVSLLATSSPAYTANYFRPVQRYAGEALLVENKALALAPSPGAAPAPPRREGPPWRIAWCGVLRCAKSLEMLARLAARPGAKLEVALHGLPARDRVPDFDAIVERVPGLSYHGAFTASDLASIHAEADFVWAIDYHDWGGDALWSLGNRLYEGLRFGAVPIALDGGEMARWLEARGVGVVLAEPIEDSLQAWLDALTPERVRALREAVAALPRSAVEADVAECRTIAARIFGRKEQAVDAERTLIVIPCLNEAAHLPRLLQDLSKDPAVAQAQIVVADGGSADASWAIAREFAQAHPQVALLHNEKRVQSAAVNLAVERYGAGADIIVRMDAHARYPEGFTGRLIAAQQASGADAVAVSLRATPQGNSCFERAVAAAQNSRLGTGGSPHRARGKRRFVDHGHHALFRKAAFVAAGGYDESFAHNEDAELDARFTARGGSILLAADIVADYFPRASARGLFQQYFNYGKGRARTFERHRTLKLRQAAPLIVAPAVFALALAPLTPWAALPCAAWLLGSLAYGVLLGVRAGDACACAAGVPAAIMHLAWSLGFWAQTLSPRVAPQERARSTRARA